MKIWGNHLKVGDTIYYEYDFCIKQSTIKERDEKSFRMPSLIMETGDRIFVNNYYYTEKQEVIDNIFEELKNIHFKDTDYFNIRSWGMSDDKDIAIKCSSNYIRIGSSIFGERGYV